MIAEAIWDQFMKIIQYVTPVSYGTATGLTAQVYQQMQADFMPAPLVVLHSPAPEVMAGVWSVLRETLLAGSANRIHKEIVAALVSKANACPYCVDAHTTMLHATAAHDVVEVILNGRHNTLTDPHQQRLLQWAIANQTPETAGAFPTPFSREEAAEMIGTVVAFQYINRMANVFLGDSLLPVPGALKGITRRVIGSAGKRFVRRLENGHSLPFVSQAILPDEFGWAASNFAVAGAFAGLVEAVESAGSRILPLPVRQLVQERVNAWQGETMGMSRRWVDTAVSGLQVEHQAAARLTLLTALASYQVDAGIVNAFRAQYPADSQLIAAAAWASLRAARRVSAWMNIPVTITEMKS